jgi:hypothetical protein
LQFKACPPLLRTEGGGFPARTMRRLLRLGIRGGFCTASRVPRTGTDIVLQQVSSNDRGKPCAAAAVKIAAGQQYARPAVRNPAVPSLSENGVSGWRSYKIFTFSRNTCTAVLRQRIRGPFKACVMGRSTVQSTHDNL